MSCYNRNVDIGAKTYGLALRRKWTVGACVAELPSNLILLVFVRGEKVEQVQHLAHRVLNSQDVGMGARGANSDGDLFTHAILSDP
ncbi:hypothetical protein ASF08_20010 [Methylobacterium sp. Leaf85]|nr:hypothetical protein ASF08_20010 [Methylobacterium sp. Leaf85]